MDTAADLSFEEIEVGARASFRRRISASDIENFAALSGDYNPLHTDAAYAATTSFERPVAHGMLLATFVSCLVGMHLPGKRCLFLDANLDFVQPVFAGDELEIVGEVKSRQDTLRTLVLRVQITAMPDRTAVRGKVTVKVL